MCPHFLELKWEGTFRFLETKTKPVFKDREKVRLHTEAFFITYPKETLNTGEIADSLMGENGKEPFSKFIIPLFEKQDRHKVLVLTKSDKVKHILEIEKHDGVHPTVNTRTVAKFYPFIIFATADFTTLQLLLI